MPSDWRFSCGVRGREFRPGSLGYDPVDLFSGKVLLFHKLRGKAVEGVSISMKQLNDAAVILIDYTPDFLIDLNCRGLAVILVCGHLPAEEYLFVLLAEADRPELGAHP